MFLGILALVGVVNEFDLKVLANLVNVLNNDDTKVRALRASVTRTIWAAYDISSRLSAKVVRPVRQLSYNSPSCRNMKKYKKLRIIFIQQ